MRTLTSSLSDYYTNIKNCDMRTLCITNIYIYHILKKLWLLVAIIIFVISVCGMRNINVTRCFISAGIIIGIARWQLTRIITYSKLYVSIDKKQIENNYYIFFLLSNKFYFVSSLSTRTQKMYLNLQ